MASMLSRIFYFFSLPKSLATLNVSLLAIAVSLNVYFQFFCVPTDWAIILIVVCFANTIFYPLLEKTKFGPGVSFVSGISLFIFIYCIIFLGKVNLYGFVLAFSGVGLVIFTPHFFVAQLIWKNVFRPSRPISRRYFTASIFLCALAVGLVGYSYSKALENMDTFQSTGFKTLDKTFLAERILGMGIIYHVRFCEFDGWRPPKHDPILVIGMWLNGRHDPLRVSLPQRLELYRRFFPDRPYKSACSCAVQYSGVYHDDPLWE